MKTPARIRTWWRAITQSARIREQVESELQFHIDEYAEDMVRRGVPEEEAGRRSRAEIGRADTQNEKYRNAIGLRLFDEIGGDLRYGLRALLRNPGFAGIAILSLAIGIGATTAMFSLIDAVLLHPFPYADAGRIVNPVVINEQHPEILTWFAMTRLQFETLRNAKSIEGLLGFRHVNLEMTGGPLPEDVSAIYLTENAGSFFGVHALLGRGIQPSDAQGSGQPVVVLNYRFWQRHYSGDRGVIGGKIQLDHHVYTIVGVMPRSFAFNDTLGIGDIYLPRSLLHDTVNPPVQWPYTPWIKIKPGVSLTSANAELGAIVHQFAKVYPERYPRTFHLQLQPIIVPYEQSTGHTLFLLLAGVLLLLFIGCSNCSVLLLARGTARQHELLVRSALGASRWRMIRQLLVEALVISFSGAVIGVAASYWLAWLPLKLSPNSFPAESIVRIDLPVLALSVGLALTCGILFGLSPALRMSRSDLTCTLQTAQRSIAGHGGKRRINLLISGQIALTLLLMATAGTAIAAFLHVMKVSLGYEPHNVMEAGIVMHWNSPSDWSAIRTRTGRAAFVEQVCRKIASVPGVLSVAVGNDVYPPAGGPNQTFEILSHSDVQQHEARIFSTGLEFFSTLKIPLLGGRVWDETENMRGDGVAVVNESFARRYWPHASPIGRQIRIPNLTSQAALVAASPESAGWRTIVGVVGDARNDGIDRPVLPAIYLPYTTLLPPYAQFYIRTQGKPLAYLHSIRIAVSSFSSDQQISNGAYDLETGIERDAQWSRQRLFSILFGSFSAMALLLALVGLFSVVSYTVAQRTKEFGVRMALGAPRAHILWVAARTALLSATVGIVYGTLVNLLLHKLLTGWMNSGSTGIASLVVTTLLLALCTFVACLIPAMRAASIHPVEALRCE